MELYLHRYFKKGMNPFRSISELPDSEIPVFMKQYFPNHQWFHANPEQRIRNRRKVEQWLYKEFVKLGGEPETMYPCYFSLGASPFLSQFESFEGETSEVKIPLKKFSSKEISFTYPDSFFSTWLSEYNKHPLFDKELNGRVFTIEKMNELISQGAIPVGQSIGTQYYEYQFYIEAQVWNYDKLLSNVET